MDWLPAVCCVTVQRLLAICVEITASDAESYYLLFDYYDQLCCSSDTDGDIVTNYFRRKSKRYGLLSFLKSAQETILPQRVKKGFWTCSNWTAACILNTLVSHAELKICRCRWSELHALLIHWSSQSLQHLFCSHSYVAENSPLDTLMPGFWIER